MTSSAHGRLFSRKIILAQDVHRGVTMRPAGGTGHFLPWPGIIATAMPACRHQRDLSFDTCESFVHERFVQNYINMLDGNQAEKGPGDQMMIPCIVMGDSIAVGVAQFRPDCESVAKSGITSKRYIETLLQAQSAQTVVISLGVNDDDTVDTLDNLREVRRNVHGGIVYWLLPGIKPRARAAISVVAREFGDRLIDTTAQAGPDHLHPTGAGYQYLATMTKMESVPSGRPFPTTAQAGPDHLHPAGQAHRHLAAITKVADVRSALPIPPRPPVLTETHKSHAHPSNASAGVLHPDENEGH